MTKKIMKSSSHLHHAKTEKIENDGGQAQVNVSSAALTFSCYGLGWYMLRRSREDGGTVAMSIMAFFNFRFDPEIPHLHLASSMVNIHSTHKRQEANLLRIWHYRANDLYQIPVHFQALLYLHPK